jgi:hypothetical protein
MLEVERHGIEIEPGDLPRKLRARCSDPRKNKRLASGEPLAECE